MIKSVSVVFTGRVRFLTFFFIFVAFVIICRLYLLQIIHGRAYADRANAQFIEPQSPLIDRGNIYFVDKNGTQITAATVREGFALAVNPTKIKDAESLYTSIKDLISVPHDEFITKATKKGSAYQLIASHLDSSVGAALQKRQLTGLIIQNDRWRFYPGGTLAAQELGFVAYSGDKQIGRYGLERFYDPLLTKSNSGLYKNFFVELFGGVNAALQGQDMQGDIVTTIEPTVQAELERQLAIYDQTWHPKLSGGIIMDPQTGEIRAMAVYPTFDLNLFNTQTNGLIYANPLVQNVYEVGSIIKPLTMAAGIDSGAITASTTYYDTGCMWVDKKKICDFDGKARGTLPMQEVLSQSLNLGASFIATRMGPVTMRNYFLDKYGFATTTGIDLPGEVKGITTNIQTSKRLVEFDTASFGQGIAMTPMETARALSSLANGGYMVTPHLVNTIHYDTGMSANIPWEDKKIQILKPETTIEVSRMLTRVVDTSLAQGQDKIEHYSVAAKTGTAQIADPVNGGYYEDRFLHSFFGYFPSYDAKFIVFLFALEPTGAPYASQTLAPPWHSLTQFLINYYNVPPDR